MISEEVVKSLVGMAEEKAEETVKSSETDIQIVSRDGESYMTDMMVSDNRVKMAVEKGLVVKAWIG